MLFYIYWGRGWQRKTERISLCQWTLCPDGLGFFLRPQASEHCLTSFIMNEIRSLFKKKSRYSERNTKKHLAVPLEPDIKQSLNIQKYVAFFHNQKIEWKSPFTLRNKKIENEIWKTDWRKEGQDQRRVKYRRRKKEVGLPHESQHILWSEESPWRWGELKLTVGCSIFRSYCASIRLLKLRWKGKWW